MTYQGELFNTTEYNTTVSVNTVVYPLTESSSVCLSDLEEYNNYTVLIRANNGAGEGDSAIITVRTLEAGMSNLVKFSIRTCSRRPLDAMFPLTNHEFSTTCLKAKFGNELIECVFEN